MHSIISKFFPLPCDTGGHILTEVLFREDGYINATKAAKVFGKDLKEFFSNKGTKEYLKAMEVIGGIPPITLKQAKRGNHYVLDAGTFLHPKLAVFFARWLDVRFAVWCDLMIDNILRGNIQTQLVIPTVEAQGLQEDVERLKAQMYLLVQENQDLKEKGFQGELPPTWATCGVFLEDKGVSFQGIKAYAADLGSLASTEMARRGMAAATLASRKGTVEKDKTYYPPEVLEIAYKKLKEQQLGIFAGMLP